ncbi:hypothetical protein BJ944DRAFT_268656 [Cunninghamella echinulata]|nr:hypothetical protein BJ944DRAFT_268656 [Cunninghamella echinulata]
MAKGEWTSFEGCGGSGYLLIFWAIFYQLQWTKVPLILSVLINLFIFKIVIQLRVAEFKRLNHSITYIYIYMYHVFKIEKSITM